MLLILEVACLIALLQTALFGFALWFGYQKVLSSSREFLLVLAALYIAAPLLSNFWQYNPYLILASPPLIITFLILLWATKPRPQIQPSDIEGQRPLRVYLQHFLWPGVLMLLLLSALLISTIKYQIPNLYFIASGTLLWLFGFTLTFTQPHSFLARFTQNKWPFPLLGEIMLWSGIFIITLPSPYWYLSIITPLTASILIFKKHRKH